MRQTAKFRTTILGNDKSTLGIQSPAAVVASLGTSKRPPIRVTINRKSNRSTVAVMGGKFMVGVERRESEDHRCGGGRLGGRDAGARHRAPPGGRAT